MDGEDVDFACGAGLKDRKKDRRLIGSTSKSNTRGSRPKQ